MDGSIGLLPLALAHFSIALHETTSFSDTLELFQGQQLGGPDRLFRGRLVPPGYVEECHHFYQWELAVLGLAFHYQALAYWLVSVVFLFL